MRRVRSLTTLLSAGLIAAGLVSATDGGAASAAGTPAAGSVARSTEWLAYLNGPLHTSYSAEQTAITPANAAELTQQWTFTAGAPYTASPTVTNAAVYIGGANGFFYKLSEHTGKVLNEVYLGTEPALTCGALGITSTATIG